MKDKFIIIDDFDGEVLNVTDRESNLKNMVAEEIMEAGGKSEHLLIYKLYATVAPIKIKLVDIEDNFPPIKK